MGSELLLGFTVDTNAAFIARELADSGVEISRRATVGDDANDIAAAVRQALERSDGVITTGGLGPTADDLTKPAVARALGREMILDEAILADLHRFWRARGRYGELPEANAQQAMLPAGAVALVNPHGTAPGVWLEDEHGRFVAMLPGVPREMREMLRSGVIPRLLAKATGTVVRSRTIRTTGIAESEIPALLGDATEVGPLSLAYLPGTDGVDLRLTARGVPADEAEALLGAAAARLRERLAHRCYGEDTADLAAVVLALARARGLRIGVAESCTGGMLGARLTAIPGASDTFAGGVIAYDDAIKTALLGVDPGALQDDGAVSERVVVQMAAGVRARLGVGIGIAVTGVAGPAGGTDEKPVGTVWVGVDTGDGTRARLARFGGNREEIRQRSVQMALEMVRRGLDA